MVKSFEDLECWKLAASMRRKLSTLAKEFPQHEKFKLADQIVRASRSVTANIAEGYGRFHYQEYIQFCRHSRGSLFELFDHLMVAFEEKYITEAQYKEYKSEIDRCLAVLNGFINYLAKAKQESSKVSEPEMSYILANPVVDPRLTDNH